MNQSFELRTIAVILEQVHEWAKLWSSIGCRSMFITHICGFWEQNHHYSVIQEEGMHFSQN